MPINFIVNNVNDGTESVINEGENEDGHHQRQWQGQGRLTTTVRTRGGWSSVMRVGTAVVDNEGEGKGEEGTSTMIGTRMRAISDEDEGCHRR